MSTSSSYRTVSVVLKSFLNSCNLDVELENRLISYHSEGLYFQFFTLLKKYLEDLSKKQGNVIYSLKEECLAFYNDFVKVLKNHMSGNLHMDIAILLSQSISDCDGRNVFLRSLKSNEKDDEKLNLLVDLTITCNLFYFGLENEGCESIESIYQTVKYDSTLDIGLVRQVLKLYAKRSLVQKRYSDYYMSALRYLGSVDISTVERSEVISITQNTCYAAIISDSPINYGFSELISMDIMKNLDGTADSWLRDFITRCNNGDVSVLTTYMGQLQSCPLFSQSLDFIIKKIRVVAFRQFIFDSETPILQLDKIAEALGCNYDEAEKTVILAMSIGLVRGHIKQSQGYVEIIWAKGLILNEDQTRKMCGQVSHWVQTVKNTLNRLPPRNFEQSVVVYDL